MGNKKKKDLIEKVEEIYATFSVIENGFETTNEKEIKETITTIKEELKELMSNAMLKDASSNGVTFANIEEYKVCRDKLNNVLTNAMNLQRLSLNANIVSNGVNVKLGISRTAIEGIDTSIKEIIDKMNNKISAYMGKKG